MLVQVKKRRKRQTCQVKHAREKTARMERNEVAELIRFSPYQDFGEHYLRSRTKPDPNPDQRRAWTIHRTSFKGTTLLRIGHELQVQRESAALGYGLKTLVEIPPHTPITQYEVMSTHHM